MVYEKLWIDFLVCVDMALRQTVPSNKKDIPNLAAGYTVRDNPFRLPQKTMDIKGRLVWDPAIEWTGGGLASTSHDLALWGHLLFNGNALDFDYLSQLLKGQQISKNTPHILYGAGVAIYKNTPLGAVYGHGGWLPGYVSSLRHYADHTLTIAFQVNTDIGIVDDSNDLVPTLERTLASMILEKL